MIKIQVDEHISNAVVKGIRAKGIEIYSVEEENLKGFSDVNILEFCKKNKRVLLTNDDDFFRLSQMGNHYGIIFLTTQFVSTGEVIRAVVRLVDTLVERDFADSWFFIP